MKYINVIANSGELVKKLKIEYKGQKTYEELIKGYEDEFNGTVILAKSGNHLHELLDKLDDNSSEVEYLDTGDVDGNRVYMRTLSYVFIRAMEKVMPNCRVIVEHTISDGLYCTIREGEKIIQLDSHLRDQLKASMRDLIERDLPIEKLELYTNEAVEIFEKMGRKDKADLLKYRKRDKVSLYKLDGLVDHFYGHMAPSTSYVKTFDLELFNYGIVLIGQEPSDKNTIRRFVPNYKLSQAYNEAENWAYMQGVTDVSTLNSLVENGSIGEVCRMYEALQQNKIMQIAEQIKSNNKRIILIAAPSSSGKTSFAYKLTTSLRVIGLRPISISLDDYFVDRKDTSLDKDGNYDFESVEALDLKRFNQDLNKLMRGEEIEKIKFDFIDGKRIYTGQSLKVEAANPVIIEGIHGLNPIVTSHISDDYKYKIYLSVITQINLDGHNRVPTTDLRLLRRMARDKFTRGKDVSRTIMEWPNVRRGENRNIFPYQEEADAIFNSSFAFDISAIKPIVIDDLENIKDDNPAYIEAARLRSFLQYFDSIEDNSDIVNTSILREFIGGSKIV